jgi:hypothetical protein
MPRWSGGEVLRCGSPRRPWRHGMRRRPRMMLSRNLILEPRSSSRRGREPLQTESQHHIATIEKHGRMDGAAQGFARRKRLEWQRRVATSCSL